MRNDSIDNVAASAIPIGPVPPVVHERLDAAERDALRAEIKGLLAAEDAVIVAHYYTDPELQALAEETGGHVSDSLDMARFGHDHKAGTLVVAGVRFMGETAKILNPEKRVLMPDLDADCSLDRGCPPDRFGDFCDRHADRTVVVYANTSAAVKARADWMVTSGIALDVVRHLASRGEKILWAPDRYLGDYIRDQTGVDMLLWNGSCIVHEEFKGRELATLIREHPHARVVVHPESPPSVIEQADYVGSASGLINEVRTASAEAFIVATDKPGYCMSSEIVRGVGRSWVGIRWWWHEAALERDVSARHRWIYRRLRCTSRFGGERHPDSQGIAHEATGVGTTIPA